MEWQYINRNKFISFTFPNLHKENGNIKNIDVNNINNSYDIFKLYFTENVFEIFAKISNEYLEEKFAKQYGDKYKEIEHTKNSYPYLYMKKGGITSLD